MRALCRLEEIPDGGAKGFAGPPGSFIGMFVVRRGEQVYAYVNSCPHVGLPLDPVPDRFLDRKGERIICAAHGARFRVEDGECISGPCLGDALEPVAVEVVEGEIRAAF